MLFKATNTGQLLKSKIEGCPVFIPIELDMGTISKLLPDSNNFKLISIEEHILEQILEQYFYKFFSGENSLVSGFADIKIDDIYLWNTAKIANNVYIKEVANSVQRFSKAIDVFVESSKITKLQLLKQNKLLRPKDKKHGIRNSNVRAGNPNNNPNAFYCAPQNKINKLLNNLLEFINNNDSLTIDKALIGMMQLILIHPFKDGNGRTSRALFIGMMRNEYGLTASCLYMLYLKNINRVEYYAAMKDYRDGDINTLKQYYLKTINWVYDSVSLLNNLFRAYSKTIGKINLKEHSECTQIIIAKPIQLKKKLDASVFQFHSKKAGNNIYINTALLNVLNQFDYYLRYELRKHQAN